MPWRDSKSDGLHITKVGLWFLVFLLVIAIGATNTGNNGLFLVLAVMAGTAAAADVASRLNVRGLRVDLGAPAEIFANHPSHLNVEVVNRSRWLPRWLLTLTLEPGDEAASQSTVSRSAPTRRRARPFLIAYLPRRAETRGQIEVMMRRRGRRRVRYAHATSLFPLGFFRRGRRYLSEIEILVYPEIYPPSGSSSAQLGRTGNEPTRRRGWGHDLLGLRAFRHGDDPRGIHWKQTARTGDLVLKEREAEESRRLLIVFDNAAGVLASAVERQRFERLVSEAATAALHYLDAGFEVSLLSRDAELPFAGGRQQRHRLLEALALIEPLAEHSRPLAPAIVDGPCLRLVMESRSPAASPAVRNESARGGAARGNVA